MFFTDGGQSATLVLAVMWCRTAASGPGSDASHHALTARSEMGVDSLAQSCGLSLPAFNQRGWYMTLSIHAASSLARIDNTNPAPPQQKRVDFLTRYRGLSPPTLFERIGLTVALSQPLSTSFDAAHRACARRPELAQRTGHPHSGPEGEGRAAREDNTDQHRVRTCRQAGNRDTDEGRQGVHRTCHPAKTTPTAIASGLAKRLAGATRQPETDGGRQAVEQGLLRHCDSRREPMSARDGPLA